MTALNNRYLNPGKLALFLDFSANNQRLMSLTKHSENHWKSELPSSSSRKFIGNLI